jgi:hypothetical protein
VGEARIVQTEPKFDDDGKIKSPRTYQLRWSPDGIYLAALSRSGVLRVLAWPSFRRIRLFRGERDDHDFLHFSPDSRFITVKDGYPFRTWDVRTGQEAENPAWAHELARGRCVVTNDGHLRVDHWSIESSVTHFRFLDVTTSASNIFEGPAKAVAGMSITPDAKLLATHSFIFSGEEDNNVFIWSLPGKSAVAGFRADSSYSDDIPIAFSPHDSTLATLAADPSNVLLWDIDTATLLGAAPKTELVSFVSAKIVLVGESNVGKSCLATRLVEDRYPTDEELGSTLGMRFLQVKPEALDPSARRRRGREGNWSSGTWAVRTSTGSSINSSCTTRPSRWSCSTRRGGGSRSRKRRTGTSGLRNSSPAGRQSSCSSGPSSTAPTF